MSHNWNNFFFKRLKPNFHRDHEGDNHHYHNGELDVQRSMEELADMIFVKKFTQANFCLIIFLPESA